MYTGTPKRIEIESITRVDEFKRLFGLKEQNLFYDELGYGLPYIAPDNKTKIMWACPHVSLAIKNHNVRESEVFVVKINYKYTSLSFVKFANLDDMKDLYKATGIYSCVCGFCPGDYLSVVSKEPSPMGKQYKRLYGVIDVYGNEILPIVFDSISDFYNNSDYILLSNFGQSRRIPRSELTDGSYRYSLTTNAQQPTGILRSFPFVEFLWAHHINPIFEVFNYASTDHQTLLLENHYRSFELIIGKSLNYKYPDSIEQLLCETRVLIRKESDNSLKFFLCNDSLKRMSVLDEDNNLMPYSIKDDFQSCIDYYIRNYWKTDAYLGHIDEKTLQRFEMEEQEYYTKNHKSLGYNLLFDALEWDPDAYWNID